MHLYRARFFGLKLWAFPFACKPIETAGSRAGDLYPRDRAVAAAYHVRALGTMRPVRGVSETLRGVRRHSPLWRRLLLALTLLAFAQAGYVTQTHVHVPAPASKVAGEKSRDRIPAPDDPQHCPFCQEYLLAGAYLFPAPVVLPLPIVAAVESFLPVREVTWSVRFSHAWRGRGPPLH